MKKTIIILLSAAAVAFSSCDKYLDQAPLSEVSPEQYLSNEQNIDTYVIKLYDFFPNHVGASTEFGYWSADTNTDNMVHYQPTDTYAPGYWKVAQSGGAYGFSNIYKCNYFLDFVLPKLESGEIKGNASTINQYVGEVYFFRAYCYFAKLREFGDYPIVTKCLPDNLQILTDASKRAPRNEVARFILSDLDKALELVSASPAGGTNRISKDVVRLFKSRVALYEGTWLKNFNGTAFVPGGPEWPGESKDYNKGYTYPSGSIDAEIQYFLGICMEESKSVADAHDLTACSGAYKNSTDDEKNQYLVMFGDLNQSKYSEVLLWRQYVMGQGSIHTTMEFIAAANCGFGLTKGLVDAFVMKDGSLIYASAEYPGDADLKRITEGRDYRASLFIKSPGDKNTHSEDSEPFNAQAFRVEPYPNILMTTPSLKYTTGYTMRKGINFDASTSIHGMCESGLIIFRASEAYMNYVEACYEKTGSLDTDAKRYWNAIRSRAGLPDYSVTVAKTNMSKETGDWGAYTAGHLVDATRYCIRRDRRCEFFGEGFRWDDIHRWRAMDQLITTPWHVLGINLWDENAGNSEFLAAQDGELDEGLNVSAKSFSKYYAPYHIRSSNKAYHGFTWKMAHYLSPIAIQHLIITGGGDASVSPLYQNPGWPTVAGKGAIY